MNEIPLPGPNARASEAAEAAAHTDGADLPQFDDLPIDLEQATLRLGVELHPDCRPLSPLLGMWRGEGEAEYPSLLGQYRYGQQITFSHDGRPFLCYEARAYLLNAAGQVLAPAAREVGWWRVQPDEGIEVVLAHAFGICEIYYGGPTSDASWEFRTDSVVRSESARDTTAAERVYAIVDGDLAYLEERALRGLPMQQHLSAQLRPVAR